MLNDTREKNENKNKHNGMYWIRFSSAVVALILGLAIIIKFLLSGYATNQELNCVKNDIVNLQATVEKQKAITQTQFEFIKEELKEIKGDVKRLINERRNQ